MKKHPLQVWAETNGYSKVDVGEMLGVSRQCVHRWYCGLTTPRTDMLVLIDGSTRGDVSIDGMVRWSSQFGKSP